MHALSSIFVVIVLGTVALASGALYLLPVLIGSIRRVPDIGSIAAINVLLGWTLIGWVVALAMALRSVGPATCAGRSELRAPAALAGTAGGRGLGRAAGAAPATARRPAPAVPPASPRQRRGLR